ncbi:NAD-dependent protein deacetylase Sirt6 isoform X3 [Cryptotermes secundus]|uniref:NAD-dependent protein deacetylase Sirt6 isoform X3 n=1 Tax=Cryptotermes secundus TaxID=105785 RepID=UPI000CD7C73B|nr:NAD-dependent protein deacetylase Sirt6 isoform X3 [Cryptotermes secundus]
MSCNYADGLSHYSNKGKLGLKEKFDSREDVGSKVVQLAEWISATKHTVIHTGAGISTSAGIPDFRGPNGVWTLEEKGLKPEVNISFDEAVPTKTHMAIVKLVESGKVQYVVSQNIDGLHLRSGLPRTHIAELHGNMFIEQCNQCGHQFVRKHPTSTVGQKCLETPCPGFRRNGRPCRGKLHDTILDWEHSLPENDLGMADFHSCIADLSICLGTTLQIVPSGNLPLYTKKFGGRLVICNLQPTKHQDRKADLIIHSYVDDVMVQLMKLLDLPIPEYSREKDPTKLVSGDSGAYTDWTIPDSNVKIMRTLYEEKCCKQSKKRACKTDIERKDDLHFEQQKRKKPKEEEMYKNSICTSQTQDVTEIVTHGLESKSNVTAAVKGDQEDVRDNTEYEVKIENDSEGKSEVIIQHPQDIPPSELQHEHNI